MPSANYAAIRAAMTARQQIVCDYQGHSREICAHAIGLNKKGDEQVLGYQFAGGSTKGLPPGGQWRFLEIAQLSNVRSRDGDWYTGDGHLKPQTCVKEVDLEVMG